MIERGIDLVSKIWTPSSFDTTGGAETPKGGFKERVGGQVRNEGVSMTL